MTIPVINDLSMALQSGKLVLKSEIEEVSMLNWFNQSTRELIKD